MAITTDAVYTTGGGWIQAGHQGVYALKNPPVIFTATDDTIPRPSETIVGNCMRFGSESGNENPAVLIVANSEKNPAEIERSANGVTVLITKANSVITNLPESSDPIPLTIVGDNTRISSVYYNRGGFFIGNNLVKTTGLLGDSLVLSTSHITGEPITLYCPAPDINPCSSAPVRGSADYLLLEGTIKLGKNCNIIGDNGEYIIKNGNRPSVR